MISCNAVSLLSFGCTLLKPDWPGRFGTIFLCSPRQAPQCFNLSFKLWWQQAFPSPWLSLTSLLSAPSSLHSIIHSHLCFPSPFLSFCCLKWIPLQSLSMKGRLQPLQTPRGSSAVFFLMLFSLCLSFLIFFLSACRAPSTAMAEEAHLHTNVQSYLKWQLNSL